MLKRLGTCCQIGTVTNNTFTKLPHTTIGKLQVSYLDKIETSGLMRDLANAKRRAKSHWLTDIYNNLQYHPDIANYVRYRYVQSKALSNCSALLTQLQYVSQWDPHLRFLRISSDLLPLFDHDVYGTLYTPELKSQVSEYLAECKRVIDKYDIRVSTHPGQYNKINSDKAHVRANTLRCLEYHMWFMEQLSSPQAGAVINVHTDGALRELPEIDRIRASGLDKWLSFENDDMSANATTELTLNMCEQYGIRFVFDIHHHYVQTGEHITPDHPLVQRGLATWGVTRPKFHFSQQRFTNPTNKRQKASHSDMITDPKLLELAGLYIEHGDIMIEAKFKNVATKFLTENLQ